jgi:hypothetical protein
LKPFFAFLIFFLVAMLVQAQTNRAMKGVLDLRNHDFSKQGNAHLNGEWEMFMSELIPPGEFKEKNDRPRDVVLFPSTWNDMNRSSKAGFGFATFHLTLLMKPQEFAIELPHFYSSYELFINGESIAANGKVGISESESVPQWLPKTVVYKSISDTLDIVIHVSNFHHAKGGLREDIIIGRTTDIIEKRNIAMASNIALSSALLLTAIVFFLLHFFVKKNQAALFFAALALTWAVRSMFSNLYVMTSYFPEFPWEVWAILFLSALFPDDVNNVFKYLFTACNLIFACMTIFSKASFYTQFLPVYLSFCGVLLLYILYVLMQAVVKAREGVWLILSCMMLGVLVFAYDLIAYQKLSLFNPVITAFGYFAVFLLMAVTLIYQYGFLKRAASSDMLTYEDLYQSSRK